MRGLLIFISSLSFLYCCGAAVKPVVQDKVVHDTVYVHDTVRLDTAQVKVYEKQLAVLRDENRQLLDSIRLVRRTMTDVRNAFFAQDMRHYLSLCEKRPQNWKYFKGWTIRSIKRLDAR